MFLIENQGFFSAFCFHKQKLVPHRASMQAYALRLARTHHLTNVPYHESSEKPLAMRLRRAGVPGLEARGISRTKHYAPPS